MAELEDRFYRLLEQHQQLKKEYRSNQHHMKQLAVKLARSTDEKKKTDPRSAREIDLEELLYDMHTKMVKLERENQRLKESNLLLKTQLSSRFKVFSSYTHVTARVDSGISHRNQRLNRLQSRSAFSLNKIPSYCTSDSNFTLKSRPQTAIRSNEYINENKFAVRLLQEAKDEIETLDQIISKQQQQLQTSDKNSDESKSNFRTEIDDFLVNEKVLEYLEQLKSQLKEAREQSSQLEKEKLTNNLLRHKLDETLKRINELEEDKSILEKSIHRCMDSCIDDFKSGLTAYTGHKEKQMLESYANNLRQLQEHCQRLQREKELIEEELIAEREMNSRIEDDYERLLKSQSESKIALTSFSDEETSRKIKRQMESDYEISHLLPFTSDSLQVDTSLGYSNSESLLDELHGMRKILETVLQQDTASES